MQQLHESSLEKKADEIGEIEVSVVLPVFNEEQNVGKLVDELVVVLEERKKPYEIIAVNAPGRDNSYKVLKELGQKYQHFIPIHMKYLDTRGYQKGYQYTLGFQHARGKYVVQMDSDYQDDPHDMHLFLEKLQEGYDLVVGWKQNRKDPFLYTFTSWGQNILSRLVTRVQVHDKNCGYKAYRASAVRALRLYGMNYRDIPMQLAAKGFKITEVPINNRKRISGKTNFTFINRALGGTIDFLSALIVSMMIDKPFRLWGGGGLILGTAGLLLELSFFVWLCMTGGISALNWWLVFWVVLGAAFWVKGTILLGIGVVTEYVRSMRNFTVKDYAILDDPKHRIVKE